MKTTVLFFGQLTDISGYASLEMAHQETVAMLKKNLYEKYPLLKGSKHIIAVNNKMVVEDEIIPENAIVAFMPPFSGG